MGSKSEKTSHGFTKSATVGSEPASTEQQRGFEMFMVVLSAFLSKILAIPLGGDLLDQNDPEKASYCSK